MVKLRPESVFHLEEYLTLINKYIFNIITLKKIKVSYILNKDLFPFRE